MKKCETVDEYLSALDPQERESLEHLRRTIKKAAPEAEEKLSYNMPGYFDHGAVCWYAVFKNHYSLFFRPQVHVYFEQQLASYEKTKSSIHIPYGKKFPATLLTKMVKYVVATNRASKKK